MWQIFKNGQGSIILRGKLKDTTTGNGKTNISSASTGLIISTIADNESTPTVYTVAGSTIESITTLGTYAAPTATKCRIKKVDDTNHPGIVELQIADARFAVANAKSLLVSVSGVSGMFDMDGIVPLTSIDLYDSVRGGMVALPNANAGTTNGLMILGTNSGAITFSNLVTMADGWVVSCTTTNRTAVTWTGNGTGGGWGVNSGSGATGNAVTWACLSSGGRTLALGNAGSGPTLTVVGAIQLATASSINTGTVTTGAVTFSTATVTGAFTVGSFVNNGVTDVAQTGDNFLYTGANFNALVYIEQVLGPWTGDSSNNILKTFQSLMRNDVAAPPTDIGGGYSSGTMSLQAIRARGDIAWITATGFATSAALAAVQTHGDSTWATAVGFATSAALAAVQTHGDSVWVTATGFAIAGDAMALTAAERNAVADAHIGRNIKGGSSTGRTVGQAYAAQRNRVAFDVPTAGSFTVFDTDDTTPLWTGTYTSDAAANPVTAIDPT